MPYAEQAISPRRRARIAKVPPRSLAFGLGAYLAAQAKRSVPFTPSIPALSGLDELEGEELATRQAHDQARADYLDAAQTTFRLRALDAITVEALQGFIAALEQVMAERPVAVSA